MAELSLPAIMISSMYTRIKVEELPYILVKREQSALDGGKPVA